MLRQIGEHLRPYLHAISSRLVLCVGPLWRRRPSAKDKTMRGNPGAVSLKTKTPEQDWRLARWRQGQALSLNATRAAPGEALQPASRIWKNPALTVQPAVQARLRTPFDVLVRVAVCGICGSDVHTSQCGADGFVAFGGPARLPVILGHEFSGTVIAKGEAVSNVTIGEAVTAESIWACHQCEQCRGGHYNECVAGELLGLTVDGAFQPTVRVDARHCFSIERLIARLGRDAGLDAGALLEPLGVAYRGLTRARLAKHDRVVIVGAGPIGLGAVMLAKQGGVVQVIVLEPSASRRALAASLGALVLDPQLFGCDPIQIAETIKDFWDGQMATLAIEAAGVEPGFHTAVATLGPRGRLLAMGRMPTTVSLDQNLLMTLGVEAIFSRGHAGYGIFETLIEMVANGQFDPLPLITARFPFSNILGAFDHARSGSGGKTMVDLREEG
jgi:threonine dehydrogenase-like Zn-dependent dehydrogenase